MVSTAFGIAITTFVGQNYGAGKWIEYAKVPAYAFLWIFIVSAVLVVFLIAAQFLFIPVIYKRQSCN